MPSKGRIVLYYFTHHEFGANGVDKTETRSRPAIVIDTADIRCDLQVFWHPSDRPATQFATLVSPHQESSGEIGKIERMTPQPGTWSWPPRVG